MELKGHEVMTRDALDAAVRDLPPNLQWLRTFLDDTVHHAMNRDVLDVITAGHWSDAGQRHHFMRAPTQTSQEAYRPAVGWIADNGFSAARSLRVLWRRKSTRDFHSGFVTGPLGYAFHAVQDSFSEAHVTRVKVGGDYYVTELHVYDEANQKPHGAWPGHEALDRRWSGELGKEATIACRELTKIVLASSLAKTDEQFGQRWRSLWQTFVDVFLRTRFEPAAATR